MKHQQIDSTARALSPEAAPAVENAPHFTPAVQRPRHDGWTAERQIAFIEKLADTGSVTAERRAEEDSGIVRWLRPDYQIPRFA